MIRASKYTVFRQLKSFLYILIIPLISGIFEFLKSGRLLFSVIVLFFAFAVIFTASVIKWRNCTIVFLKNHIIFSEGFIIKKQIKIEKEKIVSVSFKVSPIIHIAGGAEIAIKTGAIKGNKADASMILRKRDLKKFADFLELEDGRLLYKANFRECLFSSIISPTASKLFIIFPIIRELSSLSKQRAEIYHDITGTISELSHKFFSLFPVPDILTFIALVLFIIWLLTITVSYFRLFGYCLFTNERYLVIRHGFFSLEKKYILKNSLSSIHLTQTPLSYIFRRTSLHYSSLTEFPDDLTESSLILPVNNKKLPSVKEILQLYERENTQKIRPSTASTALSFCLPTILLMLLSAVVSLLLIIIFPFFTRIIIFISFITLIYLSTAFVMLFKKSEGFCVIETDNLIISNGRRFFNAEKSIIIKNKISLQKTRSNPIQQIKNTENVYFYIKSHNKIANALSVKSENKKSKVRP